MRCRYSPRVSRPHAVTHSLTRSHLQAMNILRKVMYYLPNTSVYHAQYTPVLAVFIHNYAATLAHLQRRQEALALFQEAALLDKSRFQPVLDQLDASFYSERTSTTTSTTATSTSARPPSTPYQPSCFLSFLP